jgi:two-component sensor histidine kinase
MWGDISIWGYDSGIGSGSTDNNVRDSTVFEIMSGVFRLVLARSDAISEVLETLCEQERGSRGSAGIALNSVSCNLFPSITVGNKGITGATDNNTVGVIV